MVNHARLSIDSQTKDSNHKGGSPVAWYEVFLQVRPAISPVCNPLILFGHRVSFQPDAEKTDCIWATFNSMFAGDSSMLATASLIQEGIENWLSIVSARTFSVHYHAHRVCRALEYHSPEANYGVAESLPRFQPFPSSESERKMSRIVETVAAHPRLREAARQLKLILAFLDNHETREAFQQFCHFFELLGKEFRCHERSIETRLSSLWNRLSLPLNPEAKKRMNRLFFFAGENGHAKRVLSPEESLLVKQAACRLMLQAGIRKVASSRNGKVQAR